MAFHEISIMDVWEVFRRYHTGIGTPKISPDLHYDRQIVQRYVRLASSIGHSRGTPLPPRKEVLSSLKGAECCHGRSSEAQAVLVSYLLEIAELIDDRTQAIKLKKAFLVLRERHNLTGEVRDTSFKCFVRAHRLTLKLDGSDQPEGQPQKELSVGGHTSSFR